MKHYPENRHPAYHAHVYFDATTLDRAEALCRETSERFGVAMGRVHRKPVGPHPRWSCQLAFDAAQFESVVGHLDAHRDGLTVLVHGSTGDDLLDHTDHAYWLGEPDQLDLSLFRKGESRSG